MFFHFPLSKIYEKTGRLVTCPFSYASVKTAPSGNPEGAAFCRMGKLLGVVDAVHMTDEVENLVGVVDLVVVPGDNENLENKRNNINCQ